MEGKDIKWKRLYWGLMLNLAVLIFFFYFLMQHFS